MITIRNVTSADFAQVLIVEKQSMPAMQYLPVVFDLFLSHERGEFSVAEMDGEIVACAKFTALPDNSAWLETIRVTPARQGLGIGKRFYANYFDIARREGISTMRMYTGIHNAVSKGLAERFGFQLAETFYGLTRAVVGEGGAAEHTFQPVTNPEQATALIMPHAAAWGKFVVMNRTFYKLTPALCRDLAQRGCVYAGAAGVVVLGARFMPDAALHIGFFTGDAAACLAFANDLARVRGVSQLSCLFPTSIESTKQALSAQGYQAGASEFIVMETTFNH